MIRRIGGNLAVRNDAGDAAVELERDGYTLLRGVFDAGEIAELVRECERVFDEREPDVRRREGDRPQFRYAMYDHSAAVQRAIAHPRILETVEALLGDDCHVIANTCWRNPPDHTGGPWHCDAGPHVPRPEGTVWPDEIPYPVFVIGAHLWLRDVRAADGPTAVIPGSHRSGRLPPMDRFTDPDLDYEGTAAVAPEADAGDVLLFSSDVWHRGTPATADGSGRLFVQCHYGRRDIAQRVRTTDEVNQVGEAARSRIDTERDATLLGLHKPYFYDG